MSISTTMNSFRGFIAIEIPINDMLKRIHAEIADLPTAIKLVELDNIHLTLKFLGETNEHHITQIYKIMEKSVEQIEQFTIQLKGTGVFPNKNYIKVIWVGIEQAEHLSLISTFLNKELERLGYKKDKRGFKPHLTIGRVKNAQGKDQLIGLIEQYSEVLFDEILVDSILLKKSTLTPKGPIYETKKK